MSHAAFMHVGCHSDSACSFLPCVSASFCLASCPRDSGPVDTRLCCEFDKFPCNTFLRNNLRSQWFLHVKDGRETGRKTFELLNFGYERQAMPWFCQPSSFQLFKLENLLPWSYFTFKDRCQTVDKLTAFGAVDLGNTCFSHALQIQDDLFNYF